MVKRVRALPHKVDMAFRGKGTTVAAWARERGFPESTVRDVLTGQYKRGREKTDEIRTALRRDFPKLFAGETEPAIA